MSRPLVVRLALGIVLVTTFGSCSAPSHPEGVDNDANPVVDCTGLYGTTPSPDGTYFITAFGCYADAQGTHGDPGDNCIPACLSSAQDTICAGMSGPACEESVNWYSADSGRYGCMTRLKVTNPANGKSVVVVSLDAGPSCYVEQDVHHAVLDVSPPSNFYLFGSEQGYSDRALVDVVVVDPSTPLGPVTASTTTSASSSSSSSSSSVVASSSTTGAGGSSGNGGAPGSGGSSNVGGSSNGGSLGAGGAGGGGMACSGDGDCNPGSDGSGLICAGGVCVPGCHTDAQCPGNTTCVSGQCQ